MNTTSNPPYSICLILAAIELGNPTKRNNSGNITNTIEPKIDPFKFPAPPIITIEIIKMDSIIVKLDG